MGRSLAHFSDPCLSFVGITVAGWTPSPENVKQMIAAVEEKAKNSVAFVFDLLGNSSVRFEQFDGTTSLPFKINGKYHLAGKVVITPSEIFKKTVQVIAPIIQAKGSKPCIIVPPLPRYLFARCCSDGGHCTNANDADYKSLLVSGFVRLKNELIKHLVSLGVTNFKVMDSCCVTSASTNTSITDRLNELRKVTNSDGIHFTADGHKNMATRVTDCLKTLICKPTKPLKQTTHFWRGFRSRRGSSLPRTSVGMPGWQGGGPIRGGAGGRSRGGSLFQKPRGFHPYRKW
jgi:lysophospholipase L1-like esterase